MELCEIKFSIYEFSGDQKRVFDMFCGWKFLRTWGENSFRNLKNYW